MYMYLKIVEHVDMLVQIVNAKFENEREKDNGYTGCAKIRRNSFSLY